MTAPASPSPGSLPDTNADAPPTPVTDLWRLADALERLLTTQVATTLGLTLPAFRLVGEVQRAPEGLTQRALATRLGVTPPTVSNAVDRLVAQGVLERRPDPGDQRAHRIHLAEHAPLGPGVAVLTAVNDALVADLSDDEVATLAILLPRMTRALEAHLADPPHLPSRSAPHAP